jgi:hypothetical protein
MGKRRHSSNRKKKRHSTSSPAKSSATINPNKKQRESSSQSLTSSLFGSSRSLTSSIFGSIENKSEERSLFSNSKTFQEVSRKHQQEIQKRQKNKQKTTKVSLISKENILDRRRQLTESTRNQVESITLNVNDEDIINSDDDEEEMTYVEKEEVDEGVVRLLVGRCSGVFRKQGVLIVKNMLHNNQVLQTLKSHADKVESKVCKRLDAKLGRVSYLPTSLSSTKSESSFRFQEVASRCLGRLDIRFGMDLPPFSNFYPSHHQDQNKTTFTRILWPLVQDLLGNDAQLIYMGLITSFPNSQDQPWHQDGANLFPDAELIDKLPPYAINVFVPLLDITEEIGPTEFWLASHCTDEARRTFLEALLASPSEANSLKNSNIIGPLLKAGDVLVYDYRTCHRGTSNLSSKTRPMLYLMYARPWFKEHLNFGSEKLMK